jgi:putative membrane protein
VSAPRDPDYRFTLANERTFLAWLRTSLALDAAAVAVSLVPAFGPPGTRVVLGTMIAALGVAVAVGAMWRWRRVQRSMERQEDLPHTRMPLLLGVGLGLIGIAIAVLVLLTP